MRGGLHFLSCALLLGCGSRTGLDLASEPTPPGSSSSCANAARPWLLFELTGSGAPQLYAMRSDGTELHPLALAHEGPIYASISSDGTKLLYVSFEDDTDGGNEGTLFLDDLSRGTTTPITSGDLPTYSTLSADGATVVYTLGFDVHVIDVDGSNDRLLLQQPADAPWGYGHPLFVGSTSTVLYGFGGAFGSIHVDGSANQTLVSEGSGGFDYPNPAISPDLASVAAVVECEDDTQSWLRVYSYGSLPASCDSGTKVTSTAGFSASPNDAADPSWGPTGLIAYADRTDVYLVDPAVGEPRNVTSSLTGDSISAFDPLWVSGCAPIP